MVTQRGMNTSGLNNRRLSDMSEGGLPAQTARSKQPPGSHRFFEQLESRVLFAAMSVVEQLLQPSLSGTDDILQSTTDAQSQPSRAPAPAASRARTMSVPPNNPGSSSGGAAGNAGGPTTTQVSGGRSDADFRFYLKPGTGFTSATPQPDPVGNPTDPGYGTAITANWDSAQNQAFDGSLNIGVTASHMNGVDRVDFSVNGGPWTTVRNTTRNPQSGLDDYVVTLRAGDFTSGSLEVRAIAYPARAGVPTVLNALDLQVDPNAPLAPANLTTSAFSAARIDLTWADRAANETGFKVERSLDGITYTAVATLPANTTSYHDASLQPDTHYYYRVRAENSQGFALSPANDGKTKLNCTVDGDGWTTIVPSSDSRIIYVSSSMGSDTNSGLSADAPVQTIAKAKSLVRNGMPDDLLLKRGDTFNDSFGVWNKSGRSATEPMLISAYGTGPRPVLATGIASGLETSGNRVSNLTISNLDFYANGRDPAVAGYSPVDRTGINILSSGQSLLIEGCAFRFYGTNIIAQYWQGPLANVKIRRNVIADAYQTTGHSQGIFIAHVDGLLVEQNVLDHNGWNESVPGAEATVYNHNAYITSTNTNVTFSGNISARASSHGAQVRPGGTVTNNLFIENPIGLSFGYENSGLPTPGGVQGNISGNLFIGNRDINGGKRGWAIEIGNTKPGANTRISDNIFTGDTQKAYPAIMLNYDPAGTGDVGINDLTIEDNLAYGWYKGLSISAAFVPGGSGKLGLNGLAVRNNDFQQLTASAAAAVQHNAAFLVSAEQFSGNRYSTSGANPADPSGGFSIQGATKTLNQWQATIEPTAKSTQVIYMEPTRSIASYTSTVGGAASVDAFLAAARQLCSQNWDLDYTSSAAINYVRLGFGKSPLLG